MISNPPPPEIEPVLKWIMEEVPRPTTLPEGLVSGDNCLRWCILGTMKCPLGLLKSATRGAPINGGDFRGAIPFSDDQITLTGQWWDSVPHRDRVPAMNFVWPPKVNDGS